MTTAEQTVCVSLGPRTYEILIGPDLLPRTGELIFRWYVQHAGKPPANPRGLIVSDSNVAPLHGEAVKRGLEAAGWMMDIIALPAGEQSKSLDVVTQVYDRLIDRQADRQTTIFAVGGGVVGDAAGFIAATYTRGVPFIQIPTTLLADVDSSVGGKVGVNHPRAKNMIGAFYQPFGVLIDTAALQTLPDREYRSGLAEVVKYGVIMDADFFAELEGHIDDLNRRDPDYLARVIARSCRLIDASVTERQVALLTALRLPLTLPTPVRFTAADAIARMRLDKKAVAGQLRFVLPTRMGAVETIANVPEEDVRVVLAEVGVK